MNGIKVDRYSKKIDYLITCTENEYKELSSEKYLYDDNVKLTGFSRYDILKDEAKKIITIAPTWRRGLGINGEINPDFVKSTYYKAYKGLLTNKKLLNLASKNDYKINFVLHPEMTNYTDEFYIFQNDIVNIIPTTEVNYNQIFATSKLFITDYSSTLFDFSYLKKPIILFQFDKKDFFGKHYEKGYFDYETDAFGDVLETVGEVVDKIEFYMENDFKMEDKYLDRLNKTFAFIDQLNCERILDATFYDK